MGTDGRKVGSARFFYWPAHGKGEFLDKEQKSMDSGAQAVIGRVESFAEPLLSDMGLELVDVEYRREGHGWVLRLYIDREGGVSLDDCTAVSREISRYLEVEDPIEHAYHLEVSSPGLERPLRKKKDFLRFRGRLARVRMREKLDGQRTFVGVLAGLEADEILLEMEDGRLRRLPLEDMSRARLLYEENR